MSVRLEGVVGQDPLKDSSGFTTSFKQKGQPTLIRLQDMPLDQLSQALCDEWLAHSGQALSIIPLPVISDPQTADDLLLQAEYAKLAELQAEMEVLHAQMHVILRNIMSLLRRKFTSCSSMQCVWNTAVKQASPIANLIASHFQSHQDLVNGCRDGDAQSPCSTGDQHETVVEDTEYAHDELEDAYMAQGASASPTPAAVIARPSSTTQPTSRGLASASQTSYVQASSTSSSASRATPTTISHHDVPHTRPHDAQFVLQQKLGLAIIILVLFVILSGLIIRAVLKFRDPRRRAERAARWEERVTKRLYRKAACKHKWRTFWKNLCYRKQGSEDYEEKRQVILEQEGLLDDDGSGVQKEIRTLRNASDFVRDLMQAEEGRARKVRVIHHNSDGFETADLNGGAGSSRSSNYAPSYKTDVTPPPRYEAELEGEMIIVDGFLYTSSISDITSESSIVDCSPRLSLDTGRSTILTKDTQE